MGVTVLGFPEKEVWKMTIYKILTLFKYHREFNPDRFKPDAENPDGLDDIDEALGGL